jgi:hypothetical protein
MRRLTPVLLPIVAAVGCGTTEDDRPASMAYVAEAILAPTCGQAQCHAAFTANRGDVFDSVDAARRSIHRNSLALQSDSADPSNADLIVWVTARDPFDRGIGRMPYDAPMPNADIELLKKWIGKGVPGGQCVPEDFDGKDCNGKDLLECDADGNYGATLMTCAGTCTNGACQ